MTNNIIDAIEVNPKITANASIIWMHGLGASGDDFLPIIDQFNLPTHSHVRFIFPNAPIKPITINNGMKMRAWYDIKHFDEFIHNADQNENHEGLKESQLIINNLIEHEIKRGINSKRIILAGFSQGGAMALHTGLRFNLSLGGIICLSGYLPWNGLITKERSLVNQSIPIFMAHGLFDPIVSISIGKNSCDTLVNLNYNVLWNTYLMQHTVIDKEITDINNFLNKIL